MQINKINNSNVNFKARVEVNIGEDLLIHLKNLAPDRCAKFADETVEAIAILKKVAPNIGNEKDVITFNSYKAKELDLSYNGYFQGVVCDSDLPGSVSEGMIFSLKNLAKRYDSTSKIINDLIRNLEQPLMYVFKPIKGSSDEVIKYPIAQIDPKNPTLPETIRIEDLLQRIRNLSTVV